MKSRTVVTRAEWRQCQRHLSVFSRLASYRSYSKPEQQKQGSKLGNPLSKICAMTPHSITNYETPKNSRDSIIRNFYSYILLHNLLFPLFCVLLDTIKIHVQLLLSSLMFLIKSSPVVNVFLLPLNKLNKQLCSITRKI